MKFPRRRPLDVGIDLTPLIDVVFLLLIFFMVSTTFIRESRLDVELPQADSAAQPGVDSPLEITITASGNLAVEGQALRDARPATLREALQEALESRGIGMAGGRPPLVIVADARAAHGDVVMAMDVAGGLGFTALRIATREGGGTRERAEPAGE